MNPYLLLILGILIGIILSLGIFRFHTDGEFEINTTDVDKDVYRVVFTTPLGKLPAKRYVIFKITQKKQSL